VWIPIFGGGRTARGVVDASDLESVLGDRWSESRRSAVSARWLLRPRLGGAQVPALPQGAQPPAHGGVEVLLQALQGGLSPQPLPESPAHRPYGLAPDGARCLSAPFTAHALRMRVLHDHGSARYALLLEGRAPKGPPARPAPPALGPLVGLPGRLSATLPGASARTRPHPHALCPGALDDDVLPTLCSVGAVFRPHPSRRFALGSEGHPRDPDRHLLHSLRKDRPRWRDLQISRMAPANPRRTTSPTLPPGEKPASIWGCTASNPTPSV